MNFYSKNLQFLEKYNPILYKLVTISISVHEAKTELFTEQMNALVTTDAGQCFLHSLYDRKRELQHIFAEAKLDTQAIVLFGLGMGDAISYAAENFPALEHLMVIEPNLDVFKAFLVHVDLASLLSATPKVTFILNQPVVSTASIINEAIGRDLYLSIDIAASLSYRTLYKDFYQGVHKACLEAVRRVMVNLATKRFSAEKWLTNEWRNQKHASIDLETVMELIPPMPAIIVSAGPSLSNNIHLLREAKERAVLIAVGSAMTILESHGITPHFRVAIDGNETTNKVFAAVDTAKCPLIYSSALNYEVLPQYQGIKIQMVMNTDWITQYVRKKSGKSCALIKSGHSVANVALDLVCQWRCPKVILVGQDLCYTGGQVHASGAWDDDNPSRSITHSEMIRAQDIHGNDVVTDQALSGIKAWFEELALYYPRIRFINASEGGLPIAGFQNKTLRQVLDEDIPENLNVSVMIEQALDKSNIKEAHTMDAIEIASAELEEIIQINEARMEAINQIKGMVERKDNPDSILVELEKLRAQAEEFRCVDYYVNIIHFFLADKFQALRRRFNFTENNKEQKIEALLQIFDGETVELQRFTTYNRSLIAQCDDRMPYSVWREFM